MCFVSTYSFTILIPSQTPNAWEATYTGNNKTIVILVAINFYCCVHNKQ